MWPASLRCDREGLAAIPGRMRIQVRSDQVEQAKEVIAAFERGEFALAEDPE